MDSGGTTTRRSSNPARLDPTAPLLLDMPTTPPAKQPISSSSASSFSSLLFLPFFSPSSSSSSSSSSTVFTAFIIGAWYFSNIGVLLLNKYLLTVYGFRFPIFLTALHMAACSAYGLAAVRGLRLVAYQPLASRAHLLKVAALASIFSLSVVSGNASLRFLPVSFNQAVGATTPFFTALFALALTRLREPAAVYAALLPVVLGIVLAANSEPLFHPLGFLLCLASTAGRALKSVVQGILLSSSDVEPADKLNSMNLLMHMAPIAAAILFPLALCYEPGVLAAAAGKIRADPSLALLLFANATVAYLVNLTNFLVTKHTSALTLQVLGNAKSAVAALVSVLVFRNPVTVMGVLGFGITIAGVALYSEAKKRSKPSS
ncbi:probable sugar phosphate/phosphate translocator At3g11320 [Zingiber officinale]|uniref:Sugar phosphate transporter domain-containing protein n=1 Tax=Zingiber officinale TaxID=94328 RepID=A0A8J5G4N0_ZINOF|nr:probable sugar phosphate/phosphate translocator At3g11320 [Zingiber officinale]KAG6498292.1 hypothetical protein ZIOFF_046204 [Zingiber officinale]